MIRQRSLALLHSRADPTRRAADNELVAFAKDESRLSGCEAKRAEAARVEKLDQTLVSTLLTLTLRLQKAISEQTDEIIVTSLLRCSHRNKEKTESNKSYAN